MKVLFVTDPIPQLTLKKDSSFALMIEAQNRQFDIYQCEIQDLYYSQENILADVNAVCADVASNHLKVTETILDMNLSAFDVVLMRKDPPFDHKYLHVTYLLEYLEQKGVRVLNKPQSLRDCNEKLFTLQFPELIPPLMVSSQKSKLHEFAKQHEKVVTKPLDAMGGQDIFLTHAQDPNFSVIIDHLTDHQTRPIMLQKFLPEIQQGDKRILLINGTPVDYALARIPQGTEIRGNLAAGGLGKGMSLSTRDREICEIIGPVLKGKGLFLVGIDVIGAYLTEINVTSPTCIREIDQYFKVNISAQFWDTVLTV